MINLKTKYLGLELKNPCWHPLLHYLKGPRVSNRWKKPGSAPL